MSTISRALTSVSNELPGFIKSISQSSDVSQSESSPFEDDINYHAQFGGL